MAECERTRRVGWGDEGDVGGDNTTLQNTTTARARQAPFTIFFTASMAVTDYYVLYAQATSNFSAVERSPIGTAVINFMQHAEGWRGGKKKHETSAVVHRVLVSTHLTCTTANLLHHDCNFFVSKQRVIVQQ